MQAALTCLPGDEIVKTYAKSRVELENLCKEKLFSFTSPATQGGVRAVLGAVVDMERGYAPQLSHWSENAFLLQAKVALAFFVSHTAVDEPTGRERTIVGDKALLYKLEEISAKKLAGKPVSLTDIKDFNVFMWLFSPDRQIEAKALVSSIHAQLMVTGALAESLDNDAAASSKKRKKAKTSASTVDDEVLSLFD